MSPADFWLRRIRDGQAIILFLNHFPNYIFIAFREKGQESLKATIRPETHHKQKSAEAK